MKDLKVVTTENGCRVLTLTRRPFYVSAFFLPCFGYLEKDWIDTSRGMLDLCARRVGVITWNRTMRRSTEILKWYNTHRNLSYFDLGVDVEVYGDAIVPFRRFWIMADGDDTHLALSYAQVGGHSHVKLIEKPYGHVG